MLPKTTTPAQEIFTKARQNGFNYPWHCHQVFSWIIHSCQIVGAYLILYPFFDSVMQVSSIQIIFLILYSTIEGLLITFTIVSTGSDPTDPTVYAYRSSNDARE